jgi:hypothetical protein
MPAVFATADGRYRVESITLELTGAGGCRYVSAAVRGDGEYLAVTEAGGHLVGYATSLDHLARLLPVPLTHLVEVTDHGPVRRFRAVPAAQPGGDTPDALVA